MTEAIGLTRLNDTPLGGATEFRGNMQGGDVFGVDTVPVWDGDKFAPGTNDALLLAYGGLATNQIAATAANGSLIQNWDAPTPLGGTPLQTVVDPVAGTVSVNQIGVYDITFNANAAGLANNQEYTFLLNIGGVDRNFGAVISGTNSLEVGTVAFSLTAEAANTNTPIGISVTNPGNNTYEIVTASLSIKRIG